MHHNFNKRFNMLRHSNIPHYEINFRYLKTKKLLLECIRFKIRQLYSLKCKRALRTESALTGDPLCHPR